MKVTVFTSNQRRHNYLVSQLASICETVYVVQECNTIRPGIVKDFYDNDDVMGRYFSNVVASEDRIFGPFAFHPQNVSSLSLKFGDLNSLPLSVLQPCLDADVIIVFGSSWIKGELIDELLERKAVNIHMGVAPFYRGSSCNFWACYDGNPGLVGATIHRLSKGLDQGDILFSVVPKAQSVTSFELGMLSVRAAFDNLVATVEDESILDIVPVKQDNNLRIRYSRNAEFTSDIALEYMNRDVQPFVIEEQIRNADLSDVVRPKFF